MALLSNLLSKAKSVASSFATGVDKAFGAVKTAVKDTLAAPAANTASLINSIKLGAGVKPENSALGSSNKASTDNMTYAPNMSTIYGPAVGAPIGQTGTKVLTSTGQVDKTKTALLNTKNETIGPVQTSSNKSSNQVAPNYVVDAKGKVRASTIGQTDQYGRTSSKDVGSQYKVFDTATQSYKTITPKVGFSGLSGQSSNQGFNLSAPTFGSTGAQGGGSAYTGLLTATSGLGTPSIMGSTQEDEKNKKDGGIISFSPSGTPVSGPSVMPSPWNPSGFPNPVAQSFGVPSTPYAGPTQPRFQASIPTGPTSATDLITSKASTDNIKNLAVSAPSERETIENLLNTYKAELAKLESQEPLPQNPVEDTPVQQQFIDQSEDPFGVRQALDEFKAQNTNLSQLLTDRQQVMKNIQALNNSYAPIFEDIKNNPNLPKALAQRRLEAVNQSQKKVMQGFLDQLELTNQSIDDQNTIVDRAFGIYQETQNQEEKRQDRARKNLDLFIQTGAIGGFSDNDIKAYSQLLGIPTSAIQEMKTIANTPKTEIRGSSSEGYYQISTDKNGKTTTKQIVAPIANLGTGTTGAGKPLSGDAAKVYTIAQTIIPEIQKLQQAFAGGYKKAVAGIVTGTNRELVKLVDNVADKIGRLRSGGAINVDEANRFKAQIASFPDLFLGNNEGAVNALNGLLTEAYGVMNSMNPNSSQQTSTGSTANVDLSGIDFKF